MSGAGDQPGGGRVRRQVIAEEVAARIEQLIDSGQLAVGDKLPPERELAREMRISRPTLREGIRALSAIGTVRVEHGKGSYITGHPSQARQRLAATDGFGLPTEAVERLRALLLAAAASQAAVRLDQAGVEALVEKVAGTSGRGTVEVLLGVLGNAGLGGLVAVLWPDGADAGPAPGEELLSALAAKDPVATFDAALRAPTQD